MLKLLRKYWLRKWRLGAAFLCLCSGVLAISVSSTGQQPSAEAASTAKEGAIREPVGVGYFRSPPNMSRKNGEAVGLWITLTKELMAEAGLSYAFVQVPVGRLYTNIARKSSTIQVWLGARQSEFLRLGVPVEPSLYGDLRVNIYGLQGMPPPEPSALKNVSLITLIGYRYAGFLGRLKARKSGVKTIASPSHISAFRMLTAGRAPFVLDYKAPAEFAIAQLGMDGVLSVTVSVTPATMLVSKQAEQKDLLLDRLSAASRRITARLQEKVAAP